MPEQSLTTYPNPQQWYSINAAALTWPELYRASGNPLTFALSLPIMAFFKLFHIKLPSGTLPREISFLSPRHAVPEPYAGRIAGLLNELAALGFRHFTTFTVPEMSHHPIMYTLLHQDGRAYADVTYLAAKAMIFPEIYTLFGDGHSFTTVTQKMAIAIDTYPGKTLVFGGSQPVAQLWEQHQSHAAELAAAHGGYSPDMTDDGIFTHLRGDIRRYCDFQKDRGLLVPLPEYKPLDPPFQTGAPA
ncbi:MAG: hypothetical protein ACYC63_18325 [Armatimonadota bacterium]